MRNDTLQPSPLPLHRSHPVFRTRLPEMEGRRRRALARGLLLAFGRLIEVEGAERLESIPDPAIFALNHSNTVESLLAPTALIWLRGGRPIHFLVDWMYLRLPLAGWALRQCEPVPVWGKPARWRLFERWYEKARRAGLERPVLDACLERLAAGRSLGLFPEGTRNRDPKRLLRGRAGLGELVLRSAAPVVPVGIHYPAAERLGRAPRLGRMVLRVGEPLAFSGERELAADSAGRRRQALARQVVQSVMEALAVLSGKACRPSSFSSEPFRPPPAASTEVP